MRHMQGHGVAVWTRLFGSGQRNIQNGLETADPNECLPDLSESGRARGQDVIQHSVPMAQVRIICKRKTLCQRLSQSA